MNELNDFENITDETEIYQFIESLLDSEENVSETDETDKDQCKNCNGFNLLKNDSHYICEDCGTINKEILDRGMEYNNDNNNSRVGCAINPFLPRSSMGTKLGGSNNFRLKKIQKWEQMVYRERSLLEVLKFIQNICESNNIQKAIIDNAQILFKNINNSKHLTGDKKGKQIIIRGENRIGLIAACIYYGSKMQKDPRTQKEIAKICNLNVTSVTRGCRKFREILKENEILDLVKPCDLLSYIERYCIKLKLNDDNINNCKKIANNIVKLDIASDHQPPSIAVGCIMLLADIYNLNISIKDISTKFKISEVTITKTYKKLFEIKHIINDDNLVNEYIEKTENYNSNIQI